MTFKYKILTLTALIFLFVSGNKSLGQSKGSHLPAFTVIITEKENNEPMAYAVCSLIRTDSIAGQRFTATADEDGRCFFHENVPAGIYQAHVFYMGQTFRLPDQVINPRKRSSLHIRVNYNPINIGEVIVTASESKSLSTASEIGKEAIRHIQPSSIDDLLELLPGGRSSDPNFSSPQSIRLREAVPVGSNYNTSSLGTQFMIDGVPMSNDANLQSTPTSSNYGSSFVNSGADMRSISTDDIESVEVVRGIPSVEYGDLTSGLVKIKRKQGGNAFDARFKSDMDSKLFYAGKAFEWNAANPLTLNTGINYLDAQADPRNTRQSYNRLTGSIRINKKWNDFSACYYTLGGSIDYTGSFDNQKSDRDLDNGTNGPIETYKSSYNRISMSGNFRMRSKEQTFFRGLDATVSVTSENSLIDRWKYVAMSNTVPLSTNLQEGEHDVTVVPSSYEATLQVDGKPFYAFARSTASFEISPDSRRVWKFKTGAEWSMNKNYGKGTLFDEEYPFSVDMNVRPRAFNVIPAQHQGALFLENESRLQLGRFGVEWMAGVRAQSLFNTGSEYAIEGKVYLDPRLNLHVDLPRFSLLGEEMRLGIGGGLGWHTKFPTMDQLYPDMIYYDITQLNYWPTDESKRRINVRVFKINPTNYSLKAARNFKWEIRTQLEWYGCALSVTYFKEDMKNGFRSGSQPVTMVYKNYDEQAIDGSALTGPPSLETTPYVLDTLLTTYSYTTNGSRTRKEGIEFTLTTPRIKPLRTKFTVTGAWFRTVYSNSLPGYYSPATVIDGKAYPYIGYYADEDGYVREMFNTNFTADTQIPRLGLIFSSSFQCLWFTGSKSNWKNPYPLEYIDKNNERHPFTEESASDAVLAYLVRNYNSTIYDYNRVPFSMNVNLKITKTLYRDKIALAVFANKILDYTPSYKSRYGTTVRREVQPYFGMELNFKL